MSPPPRKGLGLAASRAAAAAPAPKPGGLGLAASLRSEAPPASPNTRAAAALPDRGDPPAPGSGWDAFLDWASDESFEPSEEEVRLAMDHWTGRAPGR